MEYRDPQTGEQIVLRPTPELQDDLNAFHKSGCAHEFKELRRFPIAGGNIQVKPQCLRCGKPLGNPLPHDAKTANLDLSNARLENVYRAQREAEYQAILRKHFTTQERRGAGWQKNYDKYLASPEWAAKRDLVLGRAAGRCEGCGRETPVEVHHRSYLNLFDEFLFELVALCKKCHGRVHEPPPEETPCCSCRFQSWESEENWCALLDVPAKAALAQSGRCGPTVKLREFLR